MILGITGGTGCGKTTLLHMIEARGGLILDCDEIYHALLESDDEMLAALKERFPQAFPDGCFVRKKLGSIVYADSAALADLNAITHAAVKREVRRRLETAPALAAIDAIALFESGLNALCDMTVAVTAPAEVRVQRLMQRDGISEDYARSRIAAQHSEDWFAERCDAVLTNDGSQAAFEKKCVAFLDSHGIIKTVCAD